MPRVKIRYQVVQWVEEVRDTEDYEDCMNDKEDTNELFTIIEEELQGPAEGYVPESLYLYDNEGNLLDCY